MNPTTLAREFPGSAWQALDTRAFIATILPRPTAPTAVNDSTPPDLIDTDAVEIEDAEIIVEPLGHCDECQTEKPVTVWDQYDGRTLCVDCGLSLRMGRPVTGAEVET